MIAANNSSIASARVDLDWVSMVRENYVMWKALIGFLIDNGVTARFQ